MQSFTQKCFWRGQDVVHFILYQRDSDFEEHRATEMYVEEHSDSCARPAWIVFLGPHEDLMQTYVLFTASKRGE